MELTDKRVRDLRDENDNSDRREPYLTWALEEVLRLRGKTKALVESGHTLDVWNDELQAEHAKTADQLAALVEAAIRDYGEDVLLRRYECGLCNQRADTREGIKHWRLPYPRQRSLDGVSCPLADLPAAGAEYRERQDE